MMPSPRDQRNLWMVRSGRVGGMLMVLAVGLGVGCSRELSVELQLLAPRTPDPFVEVATVRTRAVLGSSVVILGQGRWDQGPLAFDPRVDPSVSRFLVDGLSADGQIVSFGASRPLNLIDDPPEAPIPILFTRVGVLSRIDGDRGVRRGGRAVTWPGGRTLWVGGRDAAGEARADTELMEGIDLLDGPRLPLGRTGDFEGLPLSEARALILGGDRPDEALLIDLDRNTLETFPIDPPVLSGSTKVVVDGSLVVVAGGQAESASTPTPDVWGVEPNARTVRRLGVLDIPRTQAAGALTSQRWVVLVGGRSASGPLGARRDASIFVPNRGPLDQQIVLQNRVVKPAVLSTLAGGILMGAGRTEGQGRAEIQMLSARTEQSASIGDSAPVTSLSSTVAEARWLALSDGSFLMLPEEDLDPVWLRLLPLGSTQLARPDGLRGPFTGGLRSDGLVMLRDPEGAFLVFNSGPAAVLGLGSTEGRLSIDPQRLQAQSLGLVPLRPSAWLQTARGLRGTAPPGLEGRTEPEEWVMVSDEVYQDFEMDIEVQREEGARVALMFGMQGRRHDRILWGDDITIERAQARAQDQPIECPSIPAPGIAFVRVRVRRVQDRVSLDLGINGSEDLVCVTTDAQSGYLALGLIARSAVFDRLQLRRP